jgi:hypothetical protein
MMNPRCVDSMSMTSRSSRFAATSTSRACFARSSESRRSSIASISRENAAPMTAESSTLTATVRLIRRPPLRRDLPIPGATLPHPRPSDQRELAGNVGEDTGNVTVRRWQ